MKSAFDSTGFYIILPLFAATALLFLFLNIPLDLAPYILALPLLAIIASTFVKLASKRRLGIVKGFRYTHDQKAYASTVHVFTLLVLASGPLDVYINGFKLLDPLSYADLQGIGRYIRHISTLCWTLVPIAYIYFNKRSARILLVLYAIIFSAIIIDRNRLLASFYCLIFCAALISVATTRREQASIDHSNRRRVLLIAGLVVVVFSGLGALRSGLEAFAIESSGTALQEGMLPLKSYFYFLSPLLQQIVLYVVMPLFNFGVIFSQGFINDEFLMSQLSPFSRDLFDAYPYAPLLVARFNVGTEFFPWLTYGGFPLVILSFIFMTICFVLAAQLFKRYPNIFTLLIFLRLSYLVIFMGFAPQFYILLNLGFIVLMLAMWFASAVFSRRVKRPRNLVAATA